jgi:hypothetical protein
VAKKPPIFKNCSWFLDRLPLATRLTKNINDENDNEKYYLTTKTKTKNPLMKRHCKLEGIYFSLPAFALSGN